MTVRSDIRLPALITLAFGAFVAQTTEYLPIGLLPQIGQDFAVPEAWVGALVTGYAWIAALTAIPFTLASVRIDRRRLFLGLLAIITIANGLAAIAPSYGWLLGFRLVVALTHGVFWATLAAFALRIAPGMPAGRATAIVFAGISAAVVGGVPLATAVGQWAGWRTAFGLFAAFGLMAIAAGTHLLPRCPATIPQHRESHLYRSRPLLGVVALTGLSLSAHFVSYTFVVPVLRDAAQVTGQALPALFLVFGVMGLAGNLVAGWFSGGGARRIVIAAILGMLGAQLLLVTLGSVTGVSWLAMALWGSTISMLIIGLQSWVLEIAPDAPDTASALYVATFNAGIGMGALLGGLTLAAGGADLVLATSIVSGTIALAFIAVMQRTLTSQRASR